MPQLGHHTLTFNDVYTSVKRKSSPFQEKSFTCKFRQERTTHSKPLVPFLHYKSMENVMTLKIRYIDIACVKSALRQPCTCQDFVRQPHGLVYYTARLRTKNKVERLPQRIFDMFIFFAICLRFLRGVRQPLDTHGCCKTRKVFVRLTL